MHINPADHEPTKTFFDVMNTEPLLGAGTEVNQFRMNLVDKMGVSLGWMGKNSSGYAVLVTKQAEALTLEMYPFEGTNYIRIKGSRDYLSPSAQAYLGFYGWSGATGWVKQNSQLKSEYNEQFLSLYSTDNKYLYAWDKYTILNVKFDPA
ncbi:MAG: hypothetical protein V4488_07090 [Pseudomonadota bacterium]